MNTRKLNYSLGYCLKVLSLLLLFFSLSYSYAQVQEFSKYDTTFTIYGNNTLEVEKHIKIKNTHTMGIIPGEMEFIVENAKKFRVTSLQAVDSFENSLNTRIVEYSNRTQLEVDVEYPILPGFEYEFFITYTVDFNRNGIFFKTLEVPIVKSSIPTQETNTYIQIPQSYHLTYSSENYSQITNTKILIGNSSSSYTHIEYSSIPIKVNGIRGVYVFWISILVILVSFVLFSIRRAIAKYLTDEEE